MDLSIIVVNYKTPQLTENCVMSVHEAMRGEEITYEIVLVDNHSDDGNMARLRRLENEKTRVYETEINGGFGYGNNRGVEKSTGEYVFFLNSDTILYPRTLPRMVRQMREDETLGVLGCLMRDGEDRPLVSAHSFENAGSLFAQTLVKPLIPGFLKNRRGARFTEHQTQIREYDWVSGAAMLMPRAVFDRAGGWNERFFMYMEDEELCWRVGKLGYKVALFPQFGLQHLVGKSGGSALSVFEQYKSKLMFYHDMDKRFFRLDRRLVLLQAKRHAKNLPKAEREDVMRRLRGFRYE